MVNIRNIAEAIEHALKVIAEYEPIIKYNHLQGEKGLRGILVFTKENRYCIHFRKELYMTFTYLDDEGIRKRGLGVAGDKENLYACDSAGFIPMIVLKTGKIYYYPVKEWIKWCEKRKDDPKVIRTKEIRQNEVDNWTYYNIPLSIMINYEKEQKTT